MEPKTLALYGVNVLVMAAWFFCFPLTAPAEEYRDDVDDVVTMFLPCAAVMVGAEEMGTDHHILTAPAETCGGKGKDEEEQIFAAADAADVDVVPYEGSIRDGFGEQGMIVPGTLAGGLVLAPWLYRGGTGWWRALHGVAIRGAVRGYWLVGSLAAASAVVLAQWRARPLFMAQEVLLSAGEGLHDDVISSAATGAEQGVSAGSGSDAGDSDPKLAVPLQEEQKESEKKEEEIFSDGWDQQEYKDRLKSVILDPQLYEKMAISVVYLVLQRLEMLARVVIPARHGDLQGGGLYQDTLSSKKQGALLLMYSPYVWRLLEAKTDVLTLGHSYKLFSLRDNQPLMQQYIDFWRQSSGQQRQVLASIYEESSVSAALKDVGRMYASAQSVLDIVQSVHRTYFPAGHQASVSSEPVRVRSNTSWQRALSETNKREFANIKSLHRMILDKVRQEQQQQARGVTDPFAASGEVVVRVVMEGENAGSTSSEPSQKRQPPEVDGAVLQLEYVLRVFNSTYKHVLYLQQIAAQKVQQKGLKKQPPPNLSQGLRHAVQQQDTSQNTRDSAE